MPHLRSLVAVLALVAPALAQNTAMRTRAAQDAMRVTPQRPSEDASRQLALKFEDAVMRGDLETLETTIDSTSLLDRATANVPASEKARKAFRDGALEGLRGKSGIYQSLVGSVKAGARMRFLRLTDVADGRNALLRLTSSDDAAPEYVELVLRRTADGGARAVDVWTSREGALHSTVLRHWLLAIVGDTTRTLPDKMSAEDRRWAQAGKTIDALEKAFAEGRNGDALKLWATIPEEVRRDPSLEIVRLFAARASGDGAFRTALADARQLAPRSAGIELLAADVALLEQKPLDALIAVQNAEAAIGGDPYLLALRGEITRAEGDLAAAKGLCERAIQLEPELEHAYWTLVAIANEEERFDDELKLLARLDASFQVDWRTFESSKAYEKFLESPAGQRWHAKIAMSR